MTSLPGRRGLLLDCLLILLASVATLLLFMALRSLGLPFGLRVVAMGEDYNWLLVLSSPSASARAQAFWAMNDRNPLSPWWYIAARPLYADGGNGPYLTRLLMGPLMGFSLYFMIRAATAWRARGIALGAGMLSAAWILHASPDQIAWNFIGALALSCLSVACFGKWAIGGRQQPAWYGLSILLWFVAFATYTFQVGAVIGIALLALLHPPAPAAGPLRRFGHAVLEVLPYPLLLAAFVLVWKTAQVPGMAAYYDLKPALLLSNLPKSLWAGLTIARYDPYVLQGISALGWTAMVLAALFGLIMMSLHLLALRHDPAARARDAAVVLAIAAGLVLPTTLIESMSETWSVGMRWPMVDQGWIPLLWMSGAALLLAILPLAERLRRFGLSAVAGCAAGWLLVAGLGYNHVQVRASAVEAALRSEMSALGQQVPAGAPRNFVVLVDKGVQLVTPDIMSYRVAPIWFPGKDLGLRVLLRDSPTGWESAEWARVVMDDEGASNLRIGGGRGDYSTIRVLRFDGRRIIPMPVVNADSVAGYPIDWRRSAPLQQGSALP